MIKVKLFLWDEEGIKITFFFNTDEPVLIFKTISIERYLNIIKVIVPTHLIPAL